MGSEDGVGLNDEHPQHPVNVKSFYMGKYEVTQGQYLAVMRNNPSSFTGCDKCPVESVTWSDAQEFIYTLNKLDAKYVYRLPTEAEWEYACRAETAGDYAGPVAVLAWYYDTSNKATHPVGTKDPNAFGLYDMHGNVSEWCEDWYHDSYDRAPLDGSAWASGGVQRYRVSRGGSWAVDEYFLRSALRNRDPPANRLSITGFRVVAVLRT
jgi:formylglycine-generating enzyme required for sulfatase activity